MLTLGIENLIKDSSRLKDKRVGLVANATSVDSKLNSSVDLLFNHPDINLTTIFGPQQGFWGETQDNMVEWKSGKHPRYNLPLYSLYGEERKPTEEMLENIDCLVFDLQDIGTRIYTYIWTMILCMEACAEQGIEFIVCDRPNPINGTDVEGNLSTPDFSSFVGLYPIPMRHGMTAGEVAKYINEEHRVICNLDVCEMKGWKRKNWFDDTELPWIMPSANLPTLDTATVYPGTVLFEGTNISEGRGTCRPFEFIGAPFINGFDLLEELRKYKLPGVFFRPCFFIPTFHKFSGIKCGGVQIHITNRKKFRPFATGLALLKTIRDLYPKKFEWKEPPYEYTYDNLPIDMIFGTDWIRNSLESGEGLSTILDGISNETKSFKNIREKHLIY